MEVSPPLNEAAGHMARPLWLNYTTKRAEAPDSPGRRQPCP
jgi:hypothetical protein